MPRFAANAGSGLLIAAGWMSVAASLLHIGCIIGGPDWYRFFGAGEQMALAAEQGRWMPAIVTAIIAAILAGWAIFAFSAAGRMIRLPLVRTALVLISAVLILRVFMLFVPSLWAPEQTMMFRITTSGIVAIMGYCFAIGTVRGWSVLSRRT